ncbi:MAG: hypothetical protein H7Z10_02315 [Gemmatimonadaceae bacterium]|nr:hypothetical protein [Acetobacteraceae bacterium]
MTPVEKPIISEPDAHGQAALLLTESLIHILVDKRTLTAAEAVEVVTTAAEVKVEVAEAAGESEARMRESLVLLAKMAGSFEVDRNSDRNRGTA